MLFCFFLVSTLDHNIGGTTLPGPEVSCRGNKGSCTKLPISICHPGDGRPRRRALPASSWLLHSAPASGRNIFMIFHNTNVKKHLHYTYIFPLWIALFVVRLWFRLNGTEASEVTSWNKCCYSAGFWLCWFWPQVCVGLPLFIYWPLCFHSRHTCLFEC